MKFILSITLSITTLFLMACLGDQKENVQGDDYIGVWVNPQGQTSSSDQDIIVNDRIIIEKTDKENIYATTILAKGVFTSMMFNPENGLLCASNEACFQLKDEKLRLGSQQGILTYEKEINHSQQKN